MDNKTKEMLALKQALRHNPAKASAFLQGYMGRKDAKVLQKFLTK